MQELSEIDENMVNYFSTLNISSMFPDTALYPSQKIEGLCRNNKSFIDPVKGVDKNTNNINNNINIANSGNFNHNNIQINNSNSTSILNSTIINEYSEIDNKTSQKNDYPYIPKFKINPHKFQKIIFDETGASKVYDVFIRDDFLIACGGNYVKFYNELSKHKGNTITVADITFCDSQDDFFSLSYSEIKIPNSSDKDKDNTPTQIIAVGGSKPIIRIIDIKTFSEMNQLIGHRNEIYDLKFHPHCDKSHLLLSASKDFSIRLWNVICAAQICIFAGPEGHSAEVLSIDWHLSGNYFVSSGIDYFIKIWEIDDKIKSRIALYNTSNTKPKTLIKTKNILSCNSIHENYIDCVKFNGNFILSKSVDGVIKEWLPQFNKEGDYFFIINSYIFNINETIWYMKFALDLKRNLIGVGNTNGLFNLFPLCENTDEEDRVTDEYDYFYTVKPCDTIDTKSDSLIRSVAFDEVDDYYACGNNDGEIYVGKLKII
jgi:WD40 repeat protein